MTTEVLRNMLYAGSLTLDGLGYVVLDEVHYLADRLRGAVWEEVIIQLPESVQVVALSATVSNAEEFGDWLRAGARRHHGHRGRDQAGAALAAHAGRPPAVRHLHQERGRQPRAAPAGPARAGRRPAGYRAAAARPDRPGPAGARARARPVRYRPPRRPDVIERLDAEGLLPAITFIFSRAGCDAAVQQCLAAGLRLTTPEEAGEIAEDRPRPGPRAWPTPTGSCSATPTG